MGAWREKANNLLALLDDLQVSMKDDLINLEAETLAPGSSTLSTVTVTKSSTTTTTTTPAADAADADGEEAVSPSSSRKRKHHHHHHKRRTKSPEPLEQVVEKVKEVITLDADDDVEEATPTGAGASGAGGANTEGLTAAFKSLGSSAKYIHQRYNELKKTTGAAATIWADNSDPVKKAAKTAKAAPDTGTSPLTLRQMFLPSLRSKLPRLPRTGLPTSRPRSTRRLAPTRPPSRPPPRPFTLPAARSPRPPRPSTSPPKNLSQNWRTTQTLSPTPSANSSTPRPSGFW